MNIRLAVAALALATLSGPAVGVPSFGPTLAMNTTGVRRHLGYGDPGAGKARARRRARNKAAKLARRRNRS